MAEQVSDLFATEFLGRVEDRFNQVLRLAFSGARRSHLRHDLHVLFHEKYAIYYLPCPDEVIIVRVLHGSPDIASIVDEGGFAI